MDEDACKMTPAKALPNRWVWRDWKDGSGSLQAPDGTHYFQYDLSPYYAQNGIEYKETNRINDHWEIFWGSLSQFKKYAESEAHKKYL